MHGRFQYYQNSFSEHLQEYIRPLLAECIASVFGEERSDEFTLDFFADAVVCAMERWLLAKECMPSEEFLEKIKTLMDESARFICRELCQVSRSRKNIEKTE